jgi:hypothetical protein
MGYGSGIKKVVFLQYDFNAIFLIFVKCSESHDVIEILEDLAEEVLSTTGFFHSGAEPYINALRRAS